MIFILLYLGVVVLIAVIGLLLRSAFLLIVLAIILGLTFVVLRFASSQNLEASSIVIREVKYDPASPSGPNPNVHATVVLRSQSSSQVDKVVLVAQLKSCDASGASCDVIGSEDVPVDIRIPADELRAVNVSAAFGNVPTHDDARTRFDIRVASAGHERLPIIQNIIGLFRAPAR